MAGETGAKEGTGAEFPVFKASEGAFDRAKYKEQEKAMVETDGVTARSTGKEIDEDLKKKKVSAEDATKKANKFYDESYDRNLKELAPAIERGGVYYDNAWSGINGDKIKIKRIIEEGKALDGKEIFEMSKVAAENKIGNINILKTGKATEVIERLGRDNIKDFDLYEDVKSDFDSKIKDDKLKFDPLLKKLFDVLSIVNESSGSAAEQAVSVISTPENNAMLSALSKILEAEGFNNESILYYSKKYKENVDKLAEKSSPLDSKKMDKDGNIVSATGGTGATGTTSEQKLEEKKQESPTGPTGSATTTESPGSTGPAGSTGSIESASTDTKKPETSTTGPTSTTSTEKLELVNKNATGSTGSTGSANTGKVEDVKTNTGKNKKGAKGPEFSEPVKGILDLLGLKVPSATGETGDKGKDKGKGKGTEQAEKALSDMALVDKKESKEEGKDKGTTNNKKSKNENKETKLEDKSTKNTDKKDETSTPSSPIKETQPQSLSVVNAPQPDKKEENKEENKNTTTTPSTTENKTEDKKTESTSEIKTQENKESEDKAKKDEQDKMNKDLSDNMKSMVSLLSQLNNTLKNPLIVIPNDKKFQ